MAFSMGLPMAYAAVQNQIPPVVWWMLLANLCWVLAYDTEYAMVDRDDDLKIGIKTSAITFGRFDVAAIMGFYLVHKAIWWTIFWQHANLGATLDHPGWRHAAWLITLLVALAQVGWHYLLIRTRERGPCFVAFRQNHWVGFVVFLGALALA